MVVRVLAIVEGSDGQSTDNGVEKEGLMQAEGRTLNPKP